MLPLTGLCLCKWEDPGCLGSKYGSSKSNQLEKSFVIVLTFGTSRPGPPVEHLIRAGGSSKHREASSQDSQSGPPLRHDESMTAGGPQICICSGHTSGCSRSRLPRAFSSFLGMSEVKRRNVHGLPARSAVHLGARPAVWSITSFLLGFPEGKRNSTDLSTRPGSKSSGAALLQPPSETSMLGGRGGCRPTDISRGGTTAAPYINWNLGN